MKTTMDNHKICPQCRRLSVVWDPARGEEGCLWRDCHWVNKDAIDLSTTTALMRIPYPVTNITKKGK